MYATFLLACARVNATCLKTATEGHKLAMKNRTGCFSSRLLPLLHLIFIDYRYRLETAPNYVAEQRFCWALLLCAPPPSPTPPLC